MSSSSSSAPSAITPRTAALTAKQTFKISKIREIFSILAQGIEINHYYMISKGVSTASKKTLWLDSEALRICIGESRLNVDAKNKEVVADGVYIKDIAEIREGCISHAFACYPSKDWKRNSKSLTIVGSEDSLSVEFSSEDSRNWFLERLRLMADDMLSVAEITAKRTRMGQLTISYSDLYSNFTEEEIQVNSQLKELLLRGIQVTQHFDGECISAIITYDIATTSIIILPVAEAVQEDAPTGVFGAVRSMIGAVVAPIVPKRSSVQSIALSDISDIRNDSHAYAFVLTNSTNKHQCCMSFIGTQCTISVELSSESVRDIFAERLRKFIYFALLEYKHFM